LPAQLIPVAQEPHDGVDLISKGQHERFVINKDKFDAKMVKKLKGNLIYQQVKLILCSKAARQGEFDRQRRVASGQSLIKVTQC